MRHRPTAADVRRIRLGIGEGSCRDWGRARGRGTARVPTYRLGLVAALGDAPADGSLVELVGRADAGSLFEEAA